MDRRAEDLLAPSYASALELTGPGLDLDRIPGRGLALNLARGQLVSIPDQDRLMLGLGCLITVLVVTILAVVIGFNRDELISRISNTTPNRLKLDQGLVGGIMTYILPLLGVLAALSFETSDTLRSLLDPLLRHFQ